MASRCIYREEHGQTHLEIWDDGDRRSLWFDDVILQSEIQLRDPAVLPNPVNRAMLARLMFEPEPQAVMLAGCGGGAIARWLHARAPQVRGDAVELSATVARLAHEYFDFPRPDRSNWRLVVEDVREHLMHNRRHYDFILVDLEEKQSTPAWLTEDTFLRACRDHLGPGGGLTLNLIVEDAGSTGAALQRIRRVFGPDILLLSEPEHDNLLVLAFRDDTPELPSADALTRLGMRWGIDFASLAERVTRLGSTET